MTTKTKVIKEAAGVKTIVTTLPNGKKIYRTVLPCARNNLYRAFARART